MSGNSHKQIKVIFYPGSFEDAEMNIHKDDCATVQHYNYSCHRERDYRGFPTGNTISSYYNISLRNFSVSIEKFLLENMKSLHPETFTILINARFDKNNRLLESEDRITLRGYVVDIREKFESYGVSESEDAQRHIDLKLLLCNIKYYLDNKDLTLEISND